MLNKAFTLVEIMVTAVILGIVAFIVIPNFTKTINRSYAQDALHNLMAIYAAQQYYNQNNGGGSNWCTLSCTDYTSINTNLNLNIAATGGTTYNCNPAAGTCTATPCCVATNANFTMQVVLGNAINTGSSSVPQYCSGSLNPCCSSVGSGSCP